MSQFNDYSERLLELIGAQQLGDLSHDEREELDRLIGEAGTSEAPEVLGELLLLLDAQDPEPERIPQPLADQIARGGRAAIASSAQSGGEPQLRLGGTDRDPSQSRNPSTSSSLWVWLTGLAAVVALGTGIFAYSVVVSKRQNEQEYRQRMASLQTKIEENQQIIASSRQAAEQAQSKLASLSEENRTQAQQLAANDQAQLELAAQLADATSTLKDAQLKIAKYEEPTDPAVLAQRRQQLLEVPDSIQIAWQPFDLPDAPAVQHGVRGDVVWSDTLQQGYIRFVGLEPNDPNIEQYQVWVIDDRGMEQKVSGGVFNASAQGEIIVPIEPGIEVGRVALFAVTVENPGGTWVPDLSRRVVVAPRDG